MDLSEKLDLWAASPLLLLPARITLRKNIELAMKTLAELRHQLPAATLVVTGPPGPHNSANAGYFDQLKELRSKLGLQNSVHFLAELVQKPLTSENVADLFRLADGVLLTSREEGFGIPVLEAGISGLPLFCSDIPPLRDLGEQDVRFFPADADPEDVAQTIASALLSSKEYRLSQRVKKEFTWQRIYQQHLEPLLQL
jgi:glycosyltransferase involved in cell wall biosynthesis